MNPPQRPTLLVIEPDAERRRSLALGCAAHGYEVVPTSTTEQGLAWAEALGPAVIVAPLALPGVATEEAIAALSRGLGPRTVLLLGESAADGDELPAELLYLAVGGLSDSELVRRVQLVLVGHEIGATPDPESRHLVGDVARRPLLDLVRSLARLAASGTLDLGSRGQVLLARGEVVGARAGAAGGIKAFYRLARQTEGTFQLRLDPPGEPEAGCEIAAPLAELVIGALEDRLPEPPEGRLSVLARGLAPSRDPLSRRLLEEAEQAERRGETIAVAELLDRLANPDGEIERALVALAAAGAVELAEPLTQVRIVTDSTADLPSELARRLDVAVVPLRVQLGERVLRDGVEIAPAAFYELLATRRDLRPTTSPPAREELVTAFRERLAGADLVSLHLSSALSATCGEARAAQAEALATAVERRRDGSKPRLEIFDSRSVSLGLGLQALFAQRLARRGLDAAAIVERLVAVRERIQVLFAVDTLEYLARGGRIGRAQALVGNLLGLKPILGVIDGEVVAIDRVRGGRRVQPRLLELFALRLERGRPVFAAIAHANALAWAERLRVQLAEVYDLRDLVMAEMGPVVGTHAGPGTLGAALYQPRDDEELELLTPLER